MTSPRDHAARLGALAETGTAVRNFAAIRSVVKAAEGLASALEELLQAELERERAIAEQLAANARTRWGREDALRAEVASLTAIRERAEEVRARASRLLADAATVGVTSDEWRAELRAAERILGAAPSLEPRYIAVAWVSSNVLDRKETIRQSWSTNIEGYDFAEQGYELVYRAAPLVVITNSDLGAAPSPEPPPEEQT